MPIPGLIAILVGIALIGVHIANVLGKRKALTQMEYQARVIASKSSDFPGSSAGDAPAHDSYAVETTFDLPLHGPLKHSETFSTRTDAQAWAKRFCTGSFHAVRPHPYLPGTVFLSEELRRSQPAALVIGIMAILIGACMFLA